MVEWSHYSWYINWIWQSLKVFERILMRADVNGWALLNWPPRFSGLLVLAWQWCQKMEGGLDWSLYRILDLSWIKRWKYSADWGGREGKTRKIEQVAKSKDSLVYWHDPGICCIIYCIHCNILARPWYILHYILYILQYIGTTTLALVRDIWTSKTLFRSAVEKREFGEDED